MSDIECDITGGDLPRRQSRKRYVLLICALIAAGSMQSQSLIVRLKRWLTPYWYKEINLEYIEHAGSMLVAISNQILWKRFTRVLNIGVKFATPYYKTTKGLVERLIKIMEDLLRPYIRTDAKFCDKKK